MSRWSKGYEQVVRVARKMTRCYSCGNVILPGSRFLAYTATPHNDMNQTGKWLHAPFCRNCSEHSPEWATETPG